MLGSVEFDDEFRFWTVEVSDKLPDYVLPSEVWTIEFQEFIPQLGLLPFLYFLRYMQRVFEVFDVVSGYRNFFLGEVVHGEEEGAVVLAF